MNQLKNNQVLFFATRLSAIPVIFGVCSLLAFSQAQIEKSAIIRPEKGVYSLALKGSILNSLITLKEKKLKAKKPVKCRIQGRIVPAQHSGWR